MIELAKFNELELIAKLAKITRENMLKEGLNQWTGDYPNLDTFINDYHNKSLYVYKENNIIIASITILEEHEAGYKEIKWLKEHSMVIHRIIVDPSIQKKGLGTKLFQFAINLSKINNYDSLKVDTHRDNLKMQGLIKKMNFKYIGYLKGIDRLAYELVL